MNLYAEFRYAYLWLKAFEKTLAGSSGQMQSEGIVIEWVMKAVESKLITMR